MGEKLLECLRFIQNGMLRDVIEQSNDKQFTFGDHIGFESFEINVIVQCGHGVRQSVFFVPFLHVLQQPFDVIESFPHG